jgi:hypothetical protein
LRVAKQVVVALVAPLSVGAAQLSGGIGPLGHLSSTASTWRTSAELWGTGRFENPLTNLEIAGSFTGVSGALRVGSLSARQQIFSPAIAGFRTVASLDFDQGTLLQPENGSQLRATSSLSYRRGMVGTWLGLGVERGRTAALRMGGWRQLGDWLTFAISSSVRRGTYGATPSHFWTGTYPDSEPSDSGWVYVEREGQFGDSGSAGHKLSWLETEAKMGWSRGRVSLDGVVGWRPPIDSAPGATWFRAITTVGVSRGVSVSAGLGTTVNQIPFARPAGRYATIGVRLAPAALVRPRETPEITPAASSFHIERAGEQYVVRVRLPRARIVELSGDFNGWQPVRLTREVDGTWTVPLVLKPGAYRMNLRVDGERWLPPPGVAAVDDEFNGKVGLVVVR